MKIFFIKAIFNRKNVSNIGVDWVKAKRTFLRIYPDYIQIKNTIIKNDEIKNAILKKVPSAFFIPSAILSIELEGTSHHFGLIYSKKLRNSLNINFEEKKVSINGIFLRRVIIIIFFIFLIYSVVSRFIVTK